MLHSLILFLSKIDCFSIAIGYKNGITCSQNSFKTISIFKSIVLYKKINAVYNKNPFLN